MLADDIVITRYATCLRYTRRGALPLRERYTR